MSEDAQIEIHIDTNIHAWVDMIVGHTMLMCDLAQLRLNTLENNFVKCFHDLGNDTMPFYSMDLADGKDVQVDLVFTQYPDHEWVIIEKDGKE